MMEKKQEVMYASLCQAYRAQQDDAVKEAYCESSLFSKIQIGLEQEYQSVADQKKALKSKKHRMIRYLSMGTGLAASVLLGVLILFHLPKTNLELHQSSTTPLVELSLAQHHKLQLFDLTFKARGRFFEYPLSERMAVRSAMHPVGWSTLSGVLASYISYSPLSTLRK